MPGTSPDGWGRPRRIRHLRRSIQGRQRTARGGRPDALLKATGGRAIPRLEGTFTAEDLREGLHQLFEEGYTSGVELGIPNLDEIMRLETGRVLTVTGIPGHGKSDFVDEIVLRLCTAKIGERDISVRRTRQSSIIMPNWRRNCWDTVSAKISLRRRNSPA